MINAATKSFRGWTQAGQVLGVKCAQRGFNGLPDSNNTFLNIRTEQGDPKLSAIKQLWPSRGGRAAWMRLAIEFHSFHCCERWITQKVAFPP